MLAIALNDTVVRHGVVSKAFHAFRSRYPETYVANFDQLFAWHREGKLKPHVSLTLPMSRAAEALGYAHKQGVVHRDIKPANLMYHPETDTVKVTDFGIARLTDSSKTKTGMVLGTPSFMSPEQLAGKKIEGRSDLFSLAVTLYQLLSGKLPFEGESMAQLMFKIANEPPTDILSVKPDVAPGLVAFIERAFEFNAPALIGYFRRNCSVPA